MNGIPESQTSEDAQSVNPIILIGKKRKAYSRPDLTGYRFGKLTVMFYAGTVENGKNKVPRWLCRCDCGKEKIIREADLKSRKTQSCGCLRNERIRKACTKHGMKGSAVYETWLHMKSRCNNPKDKDYKYYGGRGIEVCERWLKFKDFFEDMGERPKGLTIERINNSGNYCPNNCKWATRAEQNRNTKHNHMISYKGETRCLADWAIRLGIHRATLGCRLNKYSPEIAFNMQRSYNAIN